jgi:hypothetical protein
MGAAEDWQGQVAKALVPHDILVLNPRRDDWDPSWEQRRDNPQFRAQVEWELAALEYADRIVVYFDPATKAPITLMELGLHARPHPGKVVVCCPEGYWRKGNVDIVCARFGIRQVDSLEELVKSCSEL